MGARRFSFQPGSDVVFEMLPPPSAACNTVRFLARLLSIPKLREGWQLRLPHCLLADDPAPISVTLPTEAIEIDDSDEEALFPGSSPLAVRRVQPVPSPGGADSHREPGDEIHVLVRINEALRALPNERLHYTQGLLACLPQGSFSP